MTDFDPTDPWGSKSPWDVAQPEPQTPTAPEVPVTNPPAAVVTENPDGVTLSFKGGPGYDASLLVIRAANLAELDRKMDQEAGHLKSVMEKAAKAQAYSSALNSGGAPTAPASAPAAKPTFQNGQVQYNQAPPAVAGDSCPHGRTHRSGSNNKGPWEAMFCNERNKAAQCPPLWKQKDGSFG